MKKGSKQEQDQKARKEVPLTADEKLKKKTEEFGLKFWITKTIMTLALLLALTYVVQVWLGIELVGLTLQAIFIALSFGFFHELLHFMTARRLGYEAEWWRTTLRMGFIIDSGDKSKEQWEKDNNAIAIMPYFFVIPVAVAVLVLSAVTRQYGFAVGSIATLLLHIYSFFREGEDVEE